MNQTTRALPIPLILAFLTVMPSQGQEKQERTAEQPGGVFSIRGTQPIEQLHEAPELDSPSIGGLSARIAWSDLEPQPGRYDWSLLERVRDLTKAKKKWLMIRVTAGMLSPEWAYELKGVRSVTFTNQDVRWLKEPARMPVPWDKAYLQAWETFLQSLGRKIRDWPEVYCVQMTGGGFIGEMHLPKSNEATLKQWKDAGASEEKVNQMWQRIITVYDKNMPARVGIVLDLAMPLPGYRTQTVIREWALSKHPGRVWFQQNGLTGGPAVGPYSKILREASATTTVGYQMGGTGRAGRIQWPKAFQRAIEDKCSYLEVFSVDVLDPNRKDDLAFLAKGLKENHASKGKK